MSPFRMVAGCGLALFVAGAWCARADEAAARGVSPGAQDRTLEATSACPGFSWSAVEGAKAYELAVFETRTDGGVEPVLTQRIEGAAYSWTPPRERCLAPGREYAWVVRAERAGAGGTEPWSEPLRFRVPGAPSEEEVRAALSLLERWREEQAEAGALPLDAAGAALAAVPPPGAETARSKRPDEELLAGGPAAIRGEMTDTTGSVHGVFGVTHSPQGAGVVARNETAGADLVLDGEADGQADTLLTENGLDRPSATAQSFDIRNSGAGAMTLTIDGHEVVTVLTDQDTLAALSCGDGQLAKWIGGSWACADDDGETYLAGNQLQLAGTTFNVLEGAGSGLDADLLDGAHGSAYAAAAHVHAGEQITTGLVAEPRIAAALARDAEILPAVLAGDGAGSTLDADLLDGAHGSAYAAAAHVHAGEQIVSGTVAEPRIASALARDAEILPTVLASDGSGSTLDADLLDGAHGSSFQVRILGTCPDGQSMRGVNPDGSVVCWEVPIPPRITTVDDPANSVGEWTSLAIGTDGYPVISYYDATAGSLKVAKCNDAACAGADETITTVDDPANSVGEYTSLAIGTDGYPVISYYDGTAGSLKVAKCNDAACAGVDETITTVEDPADSVGQWTSLAIGADGFPVISYYDFSAANLKVAKCNDPACEGGDETITVVDDVANEVGRYTSIAIGADGFPVISYFDTTAGSVKVTKCNDAACAGADEAITTVDDPSNIVGRWTSIAIGTGGLPVISYLDQTAGGLKVAKCNDTACAGGDETITMVDDPANSVGSYTSIAIHADGNPVISYRDGTAYLLKLAKCNDPACAGGDETIISVDDPANEVGWYTSVALGTDGLPVISYQDSSASTLKVAKCLNPSCRY